jgi:hypothetical protein
LGNGVVDPRSILACSCGDTIGCGKLFGIESMTSSLSSKHWMYQGSASRLDAIKMCEA